MPDKITLFAENPIRYNGDNYHQETFEVDTRKQADELIACGAASDPKALAETVNETEKAEAAADKAKAEKATAEKAEADKKAADKKSGNKA